MKMDEVRQHLNQPVRFRDIRSGLESEYIMTGVILRKRGSQCYVQAELRDKQHPSSVLIASLQDVSPVEGGNHGS